jgi:LytS/YehU family sensor histidine kinase
VSLPEEASNLKIAPLILLPFVENSFKHGTSRFLSNPWINLKIELHKNVLMLKLMNGLDEKASQALPKSGTGIPNVRERLRLLYPDQHHLQISDEKDVFVVNLRLELAESKEQEPVTSSQPAVNYV